MPRVAAWMWGIGLAIFFAAAIAREVRRRAAGEFSSRVGALDHEAAAFARTFALILLVAALAAGLASCGGSTNGGGGGGGSSVTFPLTVQAQSNSTTTRLQTISITVP